MGEKVLMEINSNIKESWLIDWMRVKVEELIEFGQ